MRPAFVFDQNKCTGCQACQLACVIENELEPDASWRQINTFNERHYPGAPLFHISLACNHCAEPACMSACPAAAYFKDSATGAVLVDQNKCIGCRYCTWACPYDAPKFDHTKGVVSKCTFCNHRIKNGSRPACVELCPTGALQFERLDETEITNDVEGFTPTDLKPSIRIIPLRDYRTRAQPMHDPRIVSVNRRDRPPPRITLKSEWPLALFTLLGASLFAAIAGGSRVHSALHPLGFLGAAALGMTISSAHLGRKTRAWRAVLNLRSSWLSREVVFFTLFVGLGTAYLGIPQRPVWIGTAAVCTGLAALVSMDMVYRFTIRRVPVPHSAGVVLTGLFLMGVLSANPWIAVPVGVVKLSLYLWRKMAAAKIGARIHPLVAAVRIASGFGLPLVLIPGAAYSLVVGFVFIGEFIDRVEYYGELDVTSPALQMHLDLTKKTAP
jgi:DMSO reductase iron-sulfur subunit